MAFVIVQHLSPDFKSLMSELLARYTDIPIHRVEEGMHVAPNTIYLIPPKKEMEIRDGKLRLTDRDLMQGLTLPIDHFFRSLAKDCGSRSISIVLSGTGSDGSRGIGDVHEVGGLVIAQTPETARFDGMPNAAIDTNIVDVIVRPEEIPSVLTNYANCAIAGESQSDYEPKLDETGLETIYRILHQRNKINFSLYKPATITRRIERRIQLIQAGSLDEYVERLRNDRHESDMLYKDLLIGVTRFFRDREAFVQLEKKILPDLISQVRTGEELRIWIAACGTGEEAYSIAILIDECVARMNRYVATRIFATDVHQASLDFAHLGQYSV